MFCNTPTLQYSMISFCCHTWLRSWEMRVSMRAMSRRKVWRRAGFSSWALACCRRRLNTSWRRSRPLAANSTNVMSLSSDIFINKSAQGVAGDKFRLDGELGGGQTQRLAGDGFGDAIHFEEHIGGADDGDPRFEGAFALAHACFERLLGKGLLWENANPHLAVAFHVAGD